MRRPFLYCKNRSGRLRLARPKVEQLDDRSLPSITVTSNIDGLDFAGTGDGVPPDTIAAAGPNYIVEMVNTDIAIYTKTGTKVFQQDLSQFFASVRTGNALSDPVVIYDEQAGRFMVGVLDLNVSFLGTVSSDAFMYAVSDSSDPTQDTNGDGKPFTEMHSIDMSEGGSVFADYPRIGWNADGYYVTFNMYGTGFSSAYQHTSIISIGKATAIDANNATYAYGHAILSGGITNATLAPATMHGSIASTSSNPQPMYFVEEKLDSNGNPVDNAVRVVTATNLLSANPNVQFTDIAVTPYIQPPPAVQQGSSNTMSTNDSRMLNAEWRNNLLVATQNIGVSTDSQAHARWYEFNTSATPTLTQQGTIGLGSGANSYFPSIAINAAGDLGMTFMESSASEYLSMYVTGRSASDPLGFMQTPVLVKAGEAVYNATFDSSPFRAGDYSGITVDPNDGTFWAANEYAKTPVDTRANWGTWIANFNLGSSGSDTTPPTATLTSPNGGESWVANTVHNITWTATDNVGVTSVDLLYSTDGGATFTTIATGLANTGSYAWTVPNTPTTNGIVKVVAHDAAGNVGSDVSNAAFTITAPDTTAPTVTVTSPNGGESWAVGSVHNITWTATDNVGVTSVDLYYSTDGGATFTAIATGIANTGSYSWTVPNAQTTNGFVKVVAHDGSGNIGQDLSNAAFTISAPVGNPNDIYVWDMTWNVSQHGGWINVSVTLFVKRDSNGDGIAEASDAAASGVVTTLVLDHFLNGVFLSSTTFANAKTNGAGQVTFTLKTLIGGTFRATVTSMTRPGWNWNTRLDQDNPSWYPSAPVGPIMQPASELDASHNSAFETPPMLAHGAGPTLPAVAFQSNSPLFEVDEIIPIGALDVHGNGGP
jgi:hypothetical protein